MNKKYGIFCDNCSKIIRAINIYPEGDGKKNLVPTMTLSGAGWLCSSTRHPDKNKILQIAELIEKKEFKKLRQISPDGTFGFYCIDCDKSYCVDCWQEQAPIFEGIFYDCTVATCPAGHRHEIDD